MRYLPLTDTDRGEMLAHVGAAISMICLSMSPKKLASRAR